MKKNPLLIMIVSTALIILTFATIVFLFTRAFEQQDVYYKRLLGVNDVNVHMKNIQNRIIIENESEKYEKKGEYGLAINEYLKILNMYGKEISQGPIRSKLSSCYEKTGQYEPALKEIDWLLERKVLATPELLGRKKRIQELLKK